MSSTVFVNGVTLSDDDWFNDLNRLHYTIFADPANVSAARYTLLSGLDKITASLSGDVSLNNTANYFDGPSIAQGTSGTWWASGTVTVTDTAGGAAFSAKLWDATTVIASARLSTVNTSNLGVIALSGVIATPAANLRISVKDESSTSGVIRFNTSGNSNDSTITAIRIG